MASPNAASGFLKHFSVYTLGEILNRGLSFLLIPLYVSLLTPSDYGVLSFLIVTQSLYSIIVSMGIDTGLAGSFYIEATSAGQKRTVSTAFLFLLFANLAALAVCTMFGEPLDSLLFDGRLGAKVIALFFLMCAIDLQANFLLNTLKLRQESMAFVIWSVVGFAGKSLSIIYCVAVLHMGITGVIVGSLAGALVRLGVLWVFSSYLTLTFDRAQQRRMFIFGLPFVLDSLLYSSIMLSDRYFLSHFSSLAFVGLYQLGSQLASIVSFGVVMPFASAWSPKFFELEKSSKLDSFCQSSFKMVAIGAGTVAVITSVLSPVAIKILGADDYWQAVYLVPLLSISAVLYGMNIVTSAGLMLKRKSGLIALTMFMGLCANVAFNIVLTSRYGFIGTACANMCCFVTILLTRFKMSQSLYHILYDFRPVAAIGVLGSLAVVGSLLVADNNLSVMMFTATALTLIYLALVWLLPVFTTFEKQSIKTLLQSIVR